MTYTTVRSTAIVCMRRGLDIIIAAAGLLLLSPLLLLTGVAIALEDRFPILFKQWRVGQEGSLFQLIKFRSMRREAEGDRITAADDVRITRVGKTLRRFKLDELPQLWNVLKGEMSLIGPRPELPAFVDLGDPLWNAVIRVKPGITDLASLVYRNEEQILQCTESPERYYCDVVLPAKLNLNLYYLQNRSFWLDLKLLLLTVRFSFIPSGFDSDNVKRLFVT